MSTRLNKEIRSRVLRKLIEPEDVKLSELKDKVGELLKKNHSKGEALQNEMNDYPEGYFYTISNFTLRINGQHRGDFSSSSLRVKNNTSYKPSVSVSEMSAEAKAWRKWDDKRCFIISLKREIQDLLMSVTTTKRLFEVWPQLSKVDGLNIENSTKILAPHKELVVDLNKKLKLK